VPRQQHCCKVEYNKALNKQGTCVKIQKLIGGVGLKNQQLRTYRQGDVFEYCFLPDDGKKKLNTQGTCFENTDQAKVSALGNTNPWRHSSVHKQVSEPIIKIGGTCRNIRARMCSVWRVFSTFYYHILRMYGIYLFSCPGIFG